MPNILSKFIDKAKPRFSFHHHRNKSGSITSTTESNKGLSSSLPTPHIFGYRDDIRDDYVEPPPSKIINPFSVELKYVVVTKRVLFSSCSIRNKTYHQSSKHEPRQAFWCFY